MVTRWVFYDPVTTDSYTVPINPNSGGTPALQKTITFANTAGPNGNVLMMEGRDTPKTMSVSGIILNQAHLDAFTTWFDKRYQIQITDDLSRTFSVYITNFTPQRVRAASRPWKHTFNMTYTILDW